MSENEDDAPERDGVDEEARRHAERGNEQPANGRANHPPGGGHRVVQRQSARETHGNSNENESHHLIEDHANNFRGTRADGHAHADFVGALADRQGHHPADSRGGNRQSQQREPV